ncbi:MAG: UvrD-helicase domain-containing protein [Parabacteroides sp.]|nr:UvrD-helicase domain-containing protein [Parabacteroides sp.]
MLTVCKASAGSGKTHKLAGVYLVLLFSAPGAYRHILAVTFTNKATDEMKSRIICELYFLASGERSDYLEMLCNRYRMNEEQLRKRAKAILTDILHDYSSFNVSTIDSFFQQTMRAFTREIGLPGGYNIEMDQEAVLTEVIDNVIAHLDGPDKKELLGWLIRFAEEKIAEGSSWDLRRDILSLSRELFKESYKVFGDEVSKDISNKQSLNEFQKDLHRIINSVEKEKQKLGERALDIMRRYGLEVTDFKGGSNSSMSFFTKLFKGDNKSTPSDTFISFADNLDGWIAKKADSDVRHKIEQVFSAGLNDCVKAVVSLFGNLTDYNTARAIVKYYYTLGILTDISSEINAYRIENNVMLIADTTELLHRVIDGSNAPFIYEKTGTQVEYYMIDEFQDTSRMQWENFRPLIEESLSHGGDNLIVGDVKQSIYRFRNSDWTLLDSEVKSDFSPQLLHEETLQENWRSCRNIVEFNNALFAIMPDLMQQLYNENLVSSSLNLEEQKKYADRILSAYSHCYQQVPQSFQSKEGHVKVSFLAREEDSGKKWEELALEQIPIVLEQLQDDGYALRDIAILVRTNSEGANVAACLLDYKEEHSSERYSYDIISDESLFVSSSAAVRFLVSVLRYLKNPADTMNHMIALYEYQVLNGNFGLSEPLFDAKLDNVLQELGNQSFYETVEGLCRLFKDKFSIGEQAFLQAFLDMVFDFSRNNRSDIGSFLIWWDEKGNRKSIATPDGQNAVRIMTVHKAKGLGFKAVIVPFCDWAIDNRVNGERPVIMWCHPETAPFDKYHLLPVRYETNLSNTHFAEDYFSERMHAFIDNLNVLYVAFTRAKEELIVFAPRPKKETKKKESSDKMSLISDIIWSAMSSSLKQTDLGEKLLPLADKFDAENGLYELGRWWHPAASLNEDKTQEILMQKLSFISSSDRLRLRLHGRDFLIDDSKRKHGALMHEILSHIETRDDIAGALDFYQMNGVINPKETKEISKRIFGLLEVPDAKYWFDGTMRVFNEVDILFGKVFSRRPDRVMIAGNRVVVIDYKFGSHLDKRYNRQVLSYMKLISEMGYNRVEGYLWYIELNKIEEVKA